MVLTLICICMPRNPSPTKSTLSMSTVTRAERPTKFSDQHRGTHILGARRRVGSRRRAAKHDNQTRKRSAHPPVKADRPGKLASCAAKLHVSESYSLRYSFLRSSSRFTHACAL